MLGDLMQSKLIRPPALGKVREEVIALDEPVSIVPPDEYYFRAGLLVRLDMRVVGRMGRCLSGNVGIEPTTFHSPVIYRNELTGECTSYATAQLPLNTEPVAPGRFYFQQYPLRYYHCGGIEQGLVTWELIESFQCGQLIRSTFTQEVAYGAFYVPVSDRSDVQRLKRRLSDYHVLHRLIPPPRTPCLLQPAGRPGFRTPPLNPKKRASTRRSLPRRKGPPTEKQL